LMEKLPFYKLKKSVEYFNLIKQFWDDFNFPHKIQNSNIMNFLKV
jgi:hypothetical protein